VTNFVVIVAGQSNAVGRAPAPISDAAVAAYAPARTKIYWGGAWQLYAPGTVQTADQGPGGNHGIEPYLAYLFEKNYPNDNLFIIKYATGSTPIATNSTPNWDPATGTMYSGLRDTYLKPAFLTPELASYVPLGLLWFQGESDSLVLASANAYQANLSNLFSTLKADVPQVASFRPIIGEIRNVAANTYAATVIAAQQGFCTANDAFFLDTSFAVGGAGADAVHFQSADWKQIAANAFKPLGLNLATDAPRFKFKRVNVSSASASTAAATKAKLLAELVPGEVAADTRPASAALWLMNDAGVPVKFGAGGGVPLVAFAAYLGGAQAMPAAAATKILFDTKEYDTAGAFAGSKFQPAVAGYYQINGAVASAGAHVAAFAMIYKNGAAYKRGTNNDSAGNATVSTIVHLNGTTDYVELYGYFSTAQPIQTGSIETFMNGALVAAG
jgi:hypothetical protein